MALTQVQSGILADSTQTYGMKNRIINGDMRIAQRGTSVTGFTSGQLRTCDRIGAYVNACTWTGTQSTDAPAGFTNSNRIECTTADTNIGATEQAQFFYNIEDRDLQDFAKGTASSSPFTVSFWIKSNKTGTSVLNINDNNSRHINAAYTINQSNTWEYKTITFPGDTSGPLTNNGSTGFTLEFWLRVGSNNTGGSIQNNWTTFVSANRAAGTNLDLGLSVGDYAAITGLQLEKGSTATKFDTRSYGTELALCQRYYYLHCSGTGKSVGRGGYYTSSQVEANVFYKVNMRTTPVLVATSGTDYYVAYRNSAGDTFNSLTLADAGETQAMVYNTSEASGTAGHVAHMVTNNSLASIAFNAEL
ncbi:MAG: hypothetical protein ACOVLB_07380 [Candidatus Nanopelagicus sp.]